MRTALLWSCSRCVAMTGAMARRRASPQSCNRRVAMIFADARLWRQSAGLQLGWLAFLSSWARQRSIFRFEAGGALCRTAVTKPTLPERCQSARNRSVKFAQAAQPARKPNSGGFLQDVFRALIDEYEASLGQRLERPRAFGGVTTLSANHLVCPHKFIARAVGHCRSSILSVTCCRAVGLAFAASYIPYLLHP